MFKKIFKIGLDFLFPKNCLICQAGDELLCRKCFQALKVKDPTCPNCGVANKLGEFCPNCQSNFYLKGVLVAGDFNDNNLATLIKLYKYHFISELGEILALFMYLFLRDSVLINPILQLESERHLDLRNYLVLATPLSKRRLRWRGFNQSAILAKFISQKLKLDTSDELLRIKHKTPQAKLKQSERKNNLNNCFKWTGENLKGKNILLIDDVCTTSSTLNEMAKELKKHQAGNIWGLVLAKG